MLPKGYVRSPNYENGPVRPQPFYALQNVRTAGHWLHKTSVFIALVVCPDHPLKLESAQELLVCIAGR